jgi:glycosyltransferase involved in cell wall biosynthesis
MNILLINHYAGSNIHGMEYRPYYLSKEWVKLGHNVTIVAASHSHIRTKQPDLVEKWTEETIDGVRYIWIQTPTYEGNGIKRIVNMMAFVKELLLHAKDLSKKVNPDIVIASSTYPLDIYPAKKIAKLAKAKLVFEVHDLWPLSPMLLGNMSKYHPFIMIMQKGENDAYRFADKVVSLLPKASEHMENHGMRPEKFYFSPNGIDIELWNQATEDIPEVHQTKINQLKQDGRFLIGYAGTHGIANALDDLIDAAITLRNDPVDFILVGKGPEKERLEQKVKQMNLTNVHLLPVINKEAIPSFLDRMDSLYIGWHRSPLYQFGVSPNKLLDYMMSGKPIIHGIEAGNDLVKEAQCGLSIAPEDPAAIVDAVREMSKLPPQQREQMGQNGKRYVTETHDYRILARNFVSMLKKLH